RARPGPVLAFDERPGPGVPGRQRVVPQLGPPGVALERLRVTVRGLLPLFLLQEALRPPVVDGGGNVLGADAVPEQALAALDEGEGLRVLLVLQEHRDPRQDVAGGRA